MRSLLIPLQLDVTPALHRALEAELAESRDHHPARQHA